MCPSTHFFPRFFCQVVAMLPRTFLLEAPVAPHHSEVFATLLRANEASGINAILRVAGGWVRDTLLGVSSNDIDIAIETPEGLGAISGERFAREVASYQASLKHDAMRTVSVIRVNPALSKHIETATVCVHDIPVEFCALRKDDYTDESRIPTVSAATPHEDALRRDFTINSLFYNLHTGCVEDFSTGLDDLRSRVIRCPLPPTSTFMDDPLRLLRGVRFVGQLGNMGFHLDDSILSSVDDAMLRAIQDKVSRERVGKEFVKMLNSPVPESCLDLLLRMKLLESVLFVEVYVPPSKKKQEAPKCPLRVTKLTDSIEKWKSSDVIRYWKACIQRVIPHCQGVSFSFTDDRSFFLLFPLLILFYRLPNDDVEDRLSALCLHGLKLPQTQCQALRRMINSYHKLLCAGLSFDEFLGADLADSTKGKIVDAVLQLSELSANPAVLKFVLWMYASIEWNCEVFLDPDASSSDAEGPGAQAWELVSRYPTLLDAFTLSLPVKGSDVKQSVDILPKEIGTALLHLRRQAAIYPGSVNTAEDAISWLKIQYQK